MPKIKVPICHLALLGFVLVLEASCTTRNYVRQSMGPVNGRIEGLSEFVTSNGAAVRALDDRAQSSIRSAWASLEETERKATVAETNSEAAAQSVRSVNQQISQLESNFGEKIDMLDSLESVLIVTLNFKSNEAKLTNESKATLDELAGVLRDLNGYRLEISGFTDKSGDEDFNLALGQRRSESVVRYLAQQHQVPLRQMFSLGLGQAQAVDDNRTRRGRAVNRRVEIVLQKNGNEDILAGGNVTGSWKIHRPQ